MISVIDLNHLIEFVPIRVIRIDEKRKNNFSEKYK